MTKFYLEEATKDKIKENLLKYPDIDITVDLENPFLKGNYKCLSITCNICSFRAERNTVVLTKSKYTCLGCTAERYKVHCTKINRTYISHGRVGSLLVINATCNTCKNCLSFNVSSLNRKTKYSRKCEHCLIAHYRKISNDAGYDYVSKGYRGLTVRCRKDGNEMFVRAAHLAVNNISCEECLITSYKDILITESCNFIDLVRVKNIPTRVTYTNQVGEQFSAAAIAIKSGGFATHKETVWQDRHKTYLMITNFKGKTYCKIGTAGDPEKRMRALKLPSSTRVLVLDSFVDRFGATKLESQLHCEFTKYKLPPIIPTQFTGKTTSTKRSNGEMYRVYDGVHEWFEAEVYDILKTRYNLEENPNGPNSNTADTTTNSR